MGKLFAILLVFSLLAAVSHRAAAAQDATPARFDVAALEAQSQGAVTIGEGVRADLSPDTPEHWWTLPLRLGDTLFITANADPASALYPQISVVGPAGDLLTQDLNAAASHNALVAYFSAPQDGTYYLRVSAGAPAAGAPPAGAYTLRVGRLPATPVGQPTPTPFVAPTSPPEIVASTSTATASPPTAPPTAPPAPAGNALEIGQAVEGALLPGEKLTYAFQAEGGLPVRIDLVALTAGPNGIDPYLELYAPGGQRLFENDDLDFGLVDARLEVTLPTTGTYAVVVRSAGDRAGGMYRLSVRVGRMWQE